MVCYSIRNVLLIKLMKRVIRVSSGRTSLRGRDTPMITHHHSRGNPHFGFLPPLQPPRARSSFNKRSSEALSNYIYSLLGRKLPALRRRGKNWEIKINPHQDASGNSRLCALFSLSLCVSSPSLSLPLSLSLSWIARSAGTLRSRI